MADDTLSRRVQMAMSQENERAGVNFDSSECPEITAGRFVASRLFHDCAEFSVWGTWGTDGHVSCWNEKFMLI
jgi:hypothetical protein